ncbi:hypothetical protein OIU84_024044 [Salix udensis]|uniref:F-box domain-containing protein n=1 Tax=Salix udensis TaxID=889485 RepID=A0AAD6KGE0_9ROSI|nr:hypothetical protein OIU84_024044 [Salix udensis]
MDNGGATNETGAAKSSDGRETEIGGDQAAGYHIPQELVAEILAKLPAKSLMRFRCVCRTWSSLIRDPFFVKLHQNQSLKKPCKTGILVSSKHQLSNTYFVFADHEGKQSFEEDTISIPKSSNVLGFANGLACIVNDKYDLSVYNLSTHESISIPLPPQKVSFQDHLSFGFDPLANEYKIVKFRVHEKEQFEIFTLGTKRWRRINRKHYNFYGDMKWYDFKDPICVNGVVYWMVKSMAESLKIHLHSFDVHGEKFQQVYVPGNVLCLFSDLIQVEGCLAVIQDSECRKTFKLKMLRDYRNNVWIQKIIDIQLSPKVVRYPTLAGTLGTGEILILDDNFSGFFRLFYSDMGSTRLRSAEITMPSFFGEKKWKRYYANHFSQTGEDGGSWLYSASIFSFHHVENILPLKEDDQFEDTVVAAVR